MSGVITLGEWRARILARSWGNRPGVSEAITGEAPRKDPPRPGHARRPGRTARARRGGVRSRAALTAPPPQQQLAHLVAMHALLAQIARRAVAFVERFEPRQQLGPTRARGHQVHVTAGGYGGYQAIQIDDLGTAGRVYRGASESRKDGAALGY